MDLQFILNHAPASNDSPPSARNEDAIQEVRTRTLLSPGLSYSRFGLSPRRLDPETSSVSTASSTKRRRTRRGHVNLEPSTRSTPMGRTFSQLSAASDTATDRDIDGDGDHATIKYGVAQLSLMGKYCLHTKF
jgi:hypothetical protein